MLCLKMTIATIRGRIPSSGGIIDKYKYFKLEVEAVGRIRWLGHAAFQITTNEGKQIYIDPWLEGNPAYPLKGEELEEADLVLVTHDHFDHLGDAVRLLQGAKARAVGQPELLGVLEVEGVPGEKLLGMNTGGTVEVAGIAVTMTQAFHSSSKGSPVGFILHLPAGPVIYHAGDTGLFGDMKLFAELYNIDVALLPIGGVYTMDPLQAATAVKLLSPRVVIPMHYRTFPALAQDAKRFARLVQEKAPRVEVVVLEPGGQWEF
jgi:L-ascorbate metabolism protein UlaG (beta-lactamase superfamily)